MTTASMPWLIVGYGRVGKTLGLMADALQAQVTLTWSRSSPRHAKPLGGSVCPHLTGPPSHKLIPVLKGLSEPHLVWLPVADEAIVVLFEAIKEAIPAGSLVVHTSGSLSSEILDTGKTHLRASLHPLQAITSPTRAFSRIAECTWTIEGDEEALLFLTSLVAPLGIRPIPIDSKKKILYHAAAVTSANLLVSLMDAAIQMAQSAGIEEVDARNMLTALAASSVENLKEEPPGAALSGPVARGDEATIKAHRQALQDLEDKELLPLYDLLTDRARGLIKSAKKESL